MQHITLVCMGKLNAPFYAEGVAEYAKRLSAYCRFTVVELPEEKLNEKHAGSAQVEAALEKEAARILAAVPKGARLVPLCIEGKQPTSEELAGLLQNAAMDGGGALAFIIGSSHGLASGLKAKAFYRLSLSRLTLPHQLARLVLAEQLYRGFSINAGAKYHK